MHSWGSWDHKVLTWQDQKSLLHFSPYREAIKPFISLCEAGWRHEQFFFLFCWGSSVSFSVYLEVFILFSHYNIITTLLPSLPYLQTIPSTPPHCSLYSYPLSSLVITECLCTNVYTYVFLNTIYLGCVILYICVFSVLTF